MPFTSWVGVSTPVMVRCSSSRSPSTSHDQGGVEPLGTGGVNAPRSGANSHRCVHHAGMDWDDLRYLLAVEEAGSASAAARRLKVDKATVARRVSSLERDLGVRLLDRRASGWRTTRAGDRVASA